MVDVNRGVPGKRCGAYRPGHDIHYIQARLCSEAGPGVPNRVERVDDDGTIHLADGTTLWNHDPEGLRSLLEARGNDVYVASHGVLRVPHETGSFMVCVASEPDPCRPETNEVIPGESIADEIKRRGGTLRRIVRSDHD